MTGISFPSSPPLASTSGTFNSMGSMGFMNEPHLTIKPIGTLAERNSLPNAPLLGNSLLNLQPSILFSEGTTWNAASVAEWCAEMVCFIWFAASPALVNLDSYSFDSKHKHLRSSGTTLDANNTYSMDTPFFNKAYYPKSSMSQSPSANRTQLYPSHNFVSYVRSILKATQVSKSVLILSLFYIFRLKSLHTQLQGQNGSEYRLFITSLILANKFLDDYTFTNKTWSDLSRIPLHEITKMELQFFCGMRTNAFASSEDLAWWRKRLMVFEQRRQQDIQNLNWQEAFLPLSTIPSDHSNLLPYDSSWLGGTSGPSSKSSKRKRYSFEISDEPRKTRLHWSRSSPIGSSMDDIPKNVLISHNASDAQFSSSVSAWQNKLLTPPQSNPQPTCQRTYFEQPIIPADLNTFTENNSPISASTVSNAQFSPYSPLQQKSLFDQESLLPAGFTQSPDQGSGLNMQNAPPLILGYYRLAAGYCYGIPTFENVNQMNNVHPFNKIANMNSQGLSYMDNNIMAGTQGLSSVQKPEMPFQRPDPSPDTFGYNTSHPQLQDMSQPVESALSLALHRPEDSLSTLSISPFHAMLPTTQCPMTRTANSR